ncbi:hypothetical protein PYCCODRAFT_1445861 [Trametes coccinea BRFM310]|uniref:DRBM domain-containing protein n=1 Tax=Trametes coccinea (strain BRFM310) TaxID=1353009 RepID=A0A1Y2IJ05_TRAC3|nr:hypothetical protein PYCCODRAFT_1445861 [Trametes coccinea BRFM310]
MLEVFVHRSMKFSGAPLISDSPHGDGARPAALESKVLGAIYTDVLFNQRPMLLADEIRVETSKKLQEKVHEWVEGYRWREKVRCIHRRARGLICLQESRVLFDSYVGAVSLGGGYKVVREPGHGAGAHVPYQPPMYEHAAPPKNPVAPGRPHSAFLPLFNQIVQQCRLEVQYLGQSSGPAHAGLIGMDKGIRTGWNKQLAKEEAARQAYHAMGWASHLVDSLPNASSPTLPTNPLPNGESHPVPLAQLK